MDTTDNSAYIDNGYADREHYLRCMADDYNIPYKKVKQMANIFGEEEDFDALIIALDDLDGSYYV
jgi:hypothetical protein